MAFAWAETITAGVTTVKASHVTELRTNINTVRGKVGLAAYSWANTITQSVTTVAASHWLELRTAIDAADTANVCSVDNVTQNGTNLTTHNATYCGGHNSYYLTYADATQYSGNLGQDDGGHDFTNCPAYNNYCAAQYATVWTSVYTVNYGAQYAYCDVNYGQDWYD